MIVLLVKDIYVLQGHVELLDDGHLLIVKVNFMFANDAEQCGRCQAAEVFLVALMLHDL